MNNNTLKTMNKTLLYISLFLFFPVLAHASSYTTTTYSDGTSSITHEYGDISHTEYSNGMSSNTQKYGNISHTDYSDGSSSDSMEY